MIIEQARAKPTSLLDEVYKLDDPQRAALTLIPDLLDFAQWSQYVKVLSECGEMWGNTASAIREYGGSEENVLVYELRETALQAGSVALTLVPTLAARVKELAEKLDRIVGYLDTHNVQLENGTLGDALTYGNLVEQARCALDGEKEESK